ncbi:MAG: F0F1 ATP synthase subunit B [Bacteroidales bacterium]|jgi:F-type H+-transporting ATPase subunit b|nr:F0F1 ATP synthase subunit B [Bacteroidales bacterium]
MELVIPEFGLLFWMILSFSIVIFILLKYAWGPILRALKYREKFIERSLFAAQKAKEEMAKIEFGNEKITELAKVEKENILKEAKKVKNDILNEAKITARKEAKKIIDETKDQIEQEKMIAIDDIKNQIASLSVDIAQKILKQNLADNAKQKELINNLVKDIELN